MKAEITDSVHTEFKPFKLVISVDTPEDAAGLWHRFNVVFESLNTAYKNSRPSIGKVFDSDQIYKVFSILDDEIMKHKAACKLLGR